MYKLIILLLLIANNLSYASEKAIVIGAGPTGLLTGIKLAETGAQVSIIEKRSPEYSRMQIVTLDRDWVATLQTLDCVLFMELIEQGHARYHSEGYLDIAINQLEMALKKIAEANPNITLVYNTEVVKVKQPKKEGSPFRVKLSTGEENTFDVLIFAAGANDRLRDKFLDLSIPYSVPVTYTVSVWDKRDPSYKRKEKNHATGMPVSDHLLFLSYQQFTLLGRLLNQSELNKEVLNESIRILSAPPKEQAIPYREFDNAHHLYVGIQLPKDRADLRNAYLHLMKQPAQKEIAASCLLLIDQMTAEMIKVVWDLPETAFEWRERNTATFPLVQRALMHPVKVVELRGSQAVFAAVGDDLASPHFFSGSGLTTGRISVENIARAMRNWRKEEYAVDTIVTTLYEAQQKVIRLALDNGKPYVPFLPPEIPLQERLEKRKKELEMLSPDSLQVEMDAHGDFTAYVSEGECKKHLNMWELDKYLSKNTKKYSVK